MEGDQTNSDRELTSTVGNVMSTTSTTEEKTEPNDATPTSSTDASTTPNASQIVSDDPISSTSSDIDQKSKNLNIMSTSKESSCDAEADLLEMSMMSNVTNEKITENVEDLVQDLETLLGESTDSFNISRRSSDNISNEKASSSNTLNLEGEIAAVTGCDDLVKSDEICDKSSEIKNDSNGEIKSIENEVSNTEPSTEQNGSPIDKEEKDNISESVNDTSSGVDEISPKQPAVEEERIDESVTEKQEVEVSTDTDNVEIQESSELIEPELSNVAATEISESSPPQEVESKQHQVSEEKHELEESVEPDKDLPEKHEECSEKIENSDAIKNNEQVDSGALEVVQEPTGEEVDDEKKEESTEVEPPNIGEAEKEQAVDNEESTEVEPPNIGEAENDQAVDDEESTEVELPNIGEAEKDQAVDDEESTEVEIPNIGEAEKDQTVDESLPEENLSVPEAVEDKTSIKESDNNEDQVKDAGELPQQENTAEILEEKSEEIQDMLTDNTTSVPENTSAIDVIQELGEVKQHTIEEKKAAENDQELGTKEDGENMKEEKVEQNDHELDEQAEIKGDAIQEEKVEIDQERDVKEDSNGDDIREEKVNENEEVVPKETAREIDQECAVKESGTLNESCEQEMAEDTFDESDTKKHMIEIQEVTEETNVDDIPEGTVQPIITEAKEETEEDTESLDISTETSTRKRELIQNEIMISEIIEENKDEGPSKVTEELEEPPLTEELVEETEHQDAYTVEQFEDAPFETDDKNEAEMEPLGLPEIDDLVEAPLGSLDSQEDLKTSVELLEHEIDSVQELSDKIDSRISLTIDPEISEEVPEELKELLEADTPAESLEVPTLDETDEPTIIDSEQLGHVAPEKPPFDEETTLTDTSLQLPDLIDEPLVSDTISKEYDEEPSVETPTIPEIPIAEDFVTDDTLEPLISDLPLQDEILPEVPMAEDVVETPQDVEDIIPPIQEPLTENQSEPIEDLQTPVPSEEPDETMMAIASLENDKLGEVFHERQLSEKEIREMEALQMAVASITEGTESYDMPEEIFEESSEVPVVEASPASFEAKEPIPEEEITASNEVTGNKIDSIQEDVTESIKVGDKEKLKNTKFDNSKLREPLRISVDEKEEYVEEPSSTKITIKPLKTSEEEVSTTSHSETDEYKGSLKMTITKKSDRMHSSILKVFSADECEQDSIPEEPIPKLIIKPKMQQVEQQHSPKVSTRSSSKVASPTSSQRCGSPRVTVKSMVKSDVVSPLKITIKPVVNPDDNSKKHSPKPKEEGKSSPKITIKPVVKECEQSTGPKITIKPIPKPPDVNDTPPTTPKLTIKPIKRQDENEEERSSPKITIKPVLKPDEEISERVSSPKISIKPLIKPEEEEKERIVLKINKGNIPTPSKESKKREHSPDDEKSERLPKMKLKFSKEGGHPQIVQESNKRSGDDRSTPEKVKKRKSDKLAEDDDVKILENVSSPIVISDDSRSQHSAEVAIVENAMTGPESSMVMEISAPVEAGVSSVLTSPAAPKRRGRPRKAPLEVRPEFPDPNPIVIADEPAKEAVTPLLHESGRPKRSCRGQNVIATLGIKPRKPRGRGRGSKVNMGTREVAPIPMKPEKEPKLTKAKLKLMQQQAKKQLEEERRLEEITKIKEEARKQLEEQRRREEEAKRLAAKTEIEVIDLDDSQQSEDVENVLKRKAVDDVIIIPDEEEVRAEPPKKSRSEKKRGKKQKHTPAIEEVETPITEDKLRKLEISLTPLGTNNAEVKPTTPMAAPLISEPPTPTSSSEIPEIVLVDEETRMSAESSRAQTPAKQVLAPSDAAEESQSSGATTESGKVKPGKAPRLEVHQEAAVDVITAEQLAEYNWNNQGPFMIQEQVAHYLGIKSFKRKYPNIARRAVDVQEKDFIKESGLVSEAMCDLGLTAVNASDVLDIMYGDFQEKYEEYCKHQRDRQAKDLMNKQKALSLAASLEKNKADLTEQAVHSAAQWNATFNKTRREQRKAAMDLQTLTIHYPKGKMKQINKPKLGHYPIALVPGQFTDYYKEYTPTEINNLPINTMLYDPINITVPEESESESGSSSDSESSSSDSESSESTSSSDDCKMCTQTPVSKKVAAK